MWQIIEIERKLGIKLNENCMNTNIENIIDKIVAGRNKYKGEVTLKVDRDVLFDIGDDYLKIRQ